MALQISITIRDDDLDFFHVVNSCPDFDLAIEQAGKIMRLYDKQNGQHQELKTAE